MIDETKNQADENQQVQNSALSQDSKNLEERIEGLNQNGNKFGKKKKSYSMIIAILILVFVGGVAVGSYYFRNDIVNFLNPKEETKKVDCAMDTKECLDGSFVNRISPDCEFAECPEIIEDKTADWQTYRNKEYGFEFKYPNTLLEPQKMESNSDYSFAFYPKETGGDRLIIGYITKERVSSSNAECLKKTDNQNNESIKTLNTEATINWTKFTGTKMPIGHACIQYSDGGIVFLTFYLINDESKLIFRELISTFKFLQDTDNDGLFDDEEEKYGCDINNPDSDSDGYLDGDEVKNGYNPMGEGKL